MESWYHECNGIYRSRLVNILCLVILGDEPIEISLLQRDNNVKNVEWGPMIVQDI